MRIGSRLRVQVGVKVGLRHDAELSNFGSNEGEREREQEEQTLANAVQAQDRKLGSRLFSESRKSRSLQRAVVV